jgi:hypothetical protein
MKKYLVVVFAITLLSACAPKVGSPEWCAAMEKKDKGELSLNEAKDYTKHCIFK